MDARLHGVPDLRAFRFVLETVVPTPVELPEEFQVILEIRGHVLRDPRRTYKCIHVNDLRPFCLQNRPRFLGGPAVVEPLLLRGAL